MAKIYATLEGQNAILNGEMDRLDDDVGEVGVHNVAEAAPRIRRLFQLCKWSEVASIDHVAIYAITLDDDYAVEITLRYSDHLHERPLNTG